MVINVYNKIENIFIDIICRRDLSHFACLVSHISEYCILV